MTLIVLEGVDGAGKTTAADLIAEHYEDAGLDVVRLHHSQLRRDPMEEYLAPLALLRPGRVVLVDRSYPSELIYAPLYRGSSAIDTAALEELEAAHVRVGAVLAHVTADLDAVFDRQAERGEDYLRPEHAELVWSAYRDFFEETIVDSVVVDTTTTHSRSTGLADLYAAVVASQGGDLV